MMNRYGLPLVVVALGISGLLAGAAASSQQPLTEGLVRAYLWPESDEAFRAAAARIETDRTFTGVTRQQMAELEVWMRRGREPTNRNPVARGEVLDEFVASTPGGRHVPVLVRVPTTYDPARAWPLMFAMHGGPPGSAEAAERSARRMITVWAEAAEAAGWIVVSPAMVDAISRDRRTEDRLPYEIFHPEEAGAVIEAVRARYRIDPDRIVSTGISLGSNFSIAYGAGRPDWLSAIVPVSTEGDSREHLLRNLATVPTYVLEGAQDRNIRGVNGPRALGEILAAFEYDAVYREFADRAHEGFQEHYPEVLRWLEERPRNVAPREVIRVPHPGIVPVARQVHWVESDTRQAFVRARATGPAAIDIDARWARTLTLYLNDHIVDLNQPVTVRVNGEVVHQARVERSMRVALEEARRLGDERRVYATRLTVTVPATPAAVASATRAWETLAPTHPEGVLSFWEMYAARALEERLPSVGFEGQEAALPAAVSSASEQVGFVISAVDPTGPAARAGLAVGDVLVSFGREPFFAGRGGVAGLHHWLIRELRETPATFELIVLRDGEPRVLEASYALGPYRAG
jgi:predicted esterase